MTDQPKPDPQNGDGLRKPLERLLAAFKGMMPFPLVVQAVAEGLVRDAEAALSAPVPSPDGAREQLKAAQHCIARETLRAIRLEQTIRDSIEALEREEAEISPVVECLKTALPSSGTEAAEPVAWQNIDRIIDVLEAAGCCRNGQVISSEDHVANTIRNWLRSLSVQSSGK